MSQNLVANKKLKMSEIKIGTHNGTFHCDEVLACSMLRMLPEYEKAEIVRSRDPDILKTCDIVVDVGGTFDPKTHRYDHHQKTFTDNMNSLNPSKKWVTKLSSAGLVYCHFGAKIVAHVLGTKIDDPKTGIVYDKVYQYFVEEIDAIDNGISTSDETPKYLISTNLSARVGHLNTNWNEPSDENTVRERFDQAMKLVKSEFLDRIDYFGRTWWPAREVVAVALKNRLQVDPSGEIVELTQGGCPWKEHLFELEKEMAIEGKIKYFLYSDQNSNWRVQCVPVSVGSFQNRLSLPKAWQGLRDSELEKEIKSPGAIFVHANGFIGGHQTREGALDMAQKALTFKSE